MLELFPRAFTRLGVITANPIAFLVVGLYILAWWLWSSEAFGFHEVATAFTLVMTLLIQRAEHRDTQAIQAKLDELLHANQRADNALTRIDEREPEEIEEARDRARKRD